MTNDSSRGRPFLLRYAEVVPTQHGLPFRYNALRQVGEVCIGEDWVNAVDAPDSAIRYDATKVTEVRRETTDDS